MFERVHTKLELTSSEIEALLTSFPNGLCAFDLEMTGLSPLFDKIIEIAAVKLTPDGKVDFFHSLINPLIEIPQSTIEYHGLTNDDVRDAPTLKKPLREFLEFFENLPLVAHNAIFDAGFLIIGMNQFNYSPSLSDVFDSCKIARSIYKGKPQAPNSFKLNELASYFKIDFDHHQAMDDAMVSLKIMANCLLKLHKDETKFNLKDIAFTYKLNSFNKPSEYILPGKLKVLRELIANKETFSIMYKGGSFKGEFREVTPISLLAMPQGLVLYALCLRTNQNKYFRVKKIQSIKTLNKA